jgi:cell division protein FtsB
MMSSDTGPRRRPALTGRALLLGALVVLLVIVLASPVNRYLGSRDDVSSSSQQLKNDQAQLAQLERQKAQYGDPGYIQQKARATLNFAMPGDTVYVVVHPGQKTQIEKSTGTSSKHVASGSAWNTRLWNSVRAAGK